MLREDAKKIIDSAIAAVLPDEAVRKALTNLKEVKGNLYLVSVGKASWQMANEAYKNLEDKITSGIVITKHGYSKGPIGNLEIYEASHPTPDKDSFKATEKVIDLVNNLNEEDVVLFLLSGGGSALFEKPLIKDSDLIDINNQLLKCGASIEEINTIRKRLSMVKGGRFAKMCEPAHVYSIILSDIIGDPLDMIASGPTCNDHTTNEEAFSIVDKYHLNLSDDAKMFLNIETEKELNNVTNIITGSVKELTKAAEKICKELGYETHIISNEIVGEASEEGIKFAELVKEYYGLNKSIALIQGGETVVHIKGKGIGGRNQEFALSASKIIKDYKDVLVLSCGSDGTDGPTDAAGGLVDNNSFNELKKLNIDVDEVLNNNDSYNALNKIDGLIMTGPTGTNVNDFQVLLIKK